MLVSVNFALSLKIALLDSPGNPGVENLPANAGNVGSVHGLGGSHMPVHHNCEPVNCELILWNEKPVHHKEEWPPLGTIREKPMCSNEDPVQPKIN